jgi:hypothetical protein
MTVRNHRRRDSRRLRNVNFLAGKRQRNVGRLLVVAVALAATACGPVPEPPKPVAAAAGEWREFQGSWNAAGTRRIIPLGTDRRGSIIDLRGTMLLAGPERPGVGFLS